MRKEENDLIHRGTYDGTIYYNPANKFCIISVKTAEKDVPEEARSIRRRKDHLIRFVATGYELPRTDAVELELDGEWKKGKYGMQLQVEQWHEIVPQTKSGVEGYLASGLKGVLRDTLGMELAFPLLTLTAAPGLLHIGEQEDQHDPKPPEGKYPYQKPRLPGSAYQSHDSDDSTDQDCDAAAQKSFVVTHVVTVLPFKFCLKTKKGTAPSFSSF
jgi:hypothetical protein